MSWLRFVEPAPPRLERRRRIEDWVLLALRAAVVVLLAGAFARPFFTRPLPVVAAPRGARWLVLLDTSASMRREGVWAEALARARAVVAEAGAGGDAAGVRLGLMTFAQRAQLVLGFEEARGGDTAEARLAAVQPGWGATDLGVALVAAAEVVVDDRGPGGPVADETVVLISDLGAGARLGALGAREWPAGVSLRIERVGARPGTNLGLQPVAEAGEAAGTTGALPGTETTAAPVRVRVVANAADPGSAPAAVTARLRWLEGGAAPVELRLAPGESRVVTAPAPANAAAAGTLVLEGDRDSAGFDNQLAVAHVVPRESAIVYVGASHPAGEAPVDDLYFFSRAFPRTRTRAPVVRAFAASDPALGPAIARAELVLLAVAPPEPVLGALRSYLARGRLLVLAPPDAAAGRALAALTGAALPAWREAAGQDAVLTAVDVAHPLLRAFAEGRAADFTHIRFWRHRVVDLSGLAGARVLARFDDGSPAWATVPVDRGQIFVMTTSLGPRDSQLPLSSKLVPLLFGLLDASAGGVADAEARFVGDALPIPARTAVVVQRPDGHGVPLPAGTSAYAATDLPGFYRIEAAPEPGEASARPPTVFAVNVPPAESVVSALPLEVLERAGIPLGARAKPGSTPGAAGPRPAADRAAAQAQALEEQQRSWRWGLLAVLVLCLGEGLLLLRGSRRRGAPVVPAGDVP